jgi:chloramphenicol 3-O-phosphotransferase
MGVDLSREATRQLHLRYELAATVARRYAKAGFTVVYQDILIGGALERVVADLASCGVAVVVLCPRPEVIAAREASRAKKGYPDRGAIDAFDRVLREETPRIGLWLDTSDLTVDETVTAILERLGEPRMPEPPGDTA